MGRHDKNHGVTLTAPEITAAFQGSWGESFPPLLTVQQAAELLQLSVNSIYHLVSEGRLNGTYTKVAGKLRFIRNNLFAHACKGIPTCQR